MRHEDREHLFVPLASISFSVREPNLFQMFDVFPEVHQLNMDFGIILVQVTSNWGETLTALHHIGVYGVKREGLV